MKTFKRLRYLGIASASVLALAACGNTGETSTNGKTVIEFFNQKKEMDGTLEEIIQDTFLMLSTYIHKILTSKNGQMLVSSMI